MASRGTKRSFASINESDDDNEEELKMLAGIGFDEVDADIDVELLYNPTKLARIGSYKRTQYKCIPQFLDIKSSTPQCQEYNPSDDVDDSKRGGDKNNRVPFEVYDDLKTCQSSCSRKVLPRVHVSQIASYLDPASLGRLQQTTEKFAKDDLERQSLDYGIYLELIYGVDDEQFEEKNTLFLGPQRAICKMIKAKRGILFSRNITHELLSQWAEEPKSVLFILNCIANNKDWQVNDSDKLIIAEILRPMAGITDDVMLNNILNSHLLKFSNPNMQAAIAKAARNNPWPEVFRVLLKDAINDINREKMIATRDLYLMDLSLNTKPGINSNTKLYYLLTSGENLPTYLHQDTIGLIIDTIVKNSQGATPREREMINTIITMLKQLKYEIEPNRKVSKPRRQLAITRRTPPIIID